MKNIMLSILFFILANSLVSRNEAKRLFVARVAFSNNSESSLELKSSDQQLKQSNTPYLKLKELANRQGYEVFLSQLSKLTSSMTQAKQEILSAARISFKPGECEVQKKQVAQFHCKTNNLRIPGLKAIDISTKIYEEDSLQLHSKELGDKGIYLLRITLLYLNEGKDETFQWVTNPSHVQVSYETTRSTSRTLTSGKNYRQKKTIIVHSR